MYLKDVLSRQLQHIWLDNLQSVLFKCIYCTSRSVKQSVNNSRLAAINDKLAIAIQMPFIWLHILHVRRVQLRVINHNLSSIQLGWSQTKPTHPRIDTHWNLQRHRLQQRNISHFVAIDINLNET